MCLSILDLSLSEATYELVRMNEHVNKQPIYFQCSGMFFYKTGHLANWQLGFFGMFSYANQLTSDF